MSGLSMTNEGFDTLFDGPRRKPESPLTQREMDLAASIQVVVEECMLRQANYLHKETGLDNLVMAGGVALNCVGNGKLLRNGPFKNIWIQPAAGDAGGALGAALCTWYGYLDKPRLTDEKHDSQSQSLLGPEFSTDEAVDQLAQFGAVYKRVTGDELYKVTADILSQEKVIGWFQGRMEFGPRALGNRSIIGDPRSTEMQANMNLKIKFRESFRPFAPAVLREDVSKYFELDYDSPYMLLVAPVKEERRVKMTDDQEKLFGIAKLNVAKSDLPAITHVDYSARVQTVEARNHPRFYKLLSAFKEKTGCSVLVNTSFNVRGEPIVCTPADAYACFMRTNMDALIVGDLVMLKQDQPKWQEREDWLTKFELD
jgi:carbamoyltransferase